MAYTLDPATRVITVPKTDLVNVSGTLYVLDTEVFRDNMNALLDDEDYIWMPDWAQRNAPVTVAGVTLAQTIEMINGYSLTFDDSGGTDAYSVRLEGSNNNLFDIQNGILNQNLVQVIPTNSAGLTYSKQVEDSAYLDQRIWIDTTIGTSGTSYPIGTPALPALTFSEGTAIQTNRALPPRYRVVGSITATTGTDLDNFDILGAAHNLSVFTVDTGASTDGTVFEQVALSGNLDGVTVVKACSIQNLGGFAGQMFTSGMGATVTLASGVTTHEFVDCHSDVAGASTPIIDCNSLVNLDLSVRTYTGGLKITNVTDAGSSVSVDFNGRLTLDSTCTAGTIVVGGSGQLTDNTGAGCTVLRGSFTESQLLTDVHEDRGLSAANPKTITENTAGSDYDEDTTNVSKTVVKSGSVTTITRI